MADFSGGKGHRMAAILIVATLFLAGAAHNSLGPTPNLPEAVTGASIAGLLIILFFVLRSHRRLASTLDSWIVTNGGAIASGGAHLGPHLITPATVLTRYQVVMSFLVVTFRFPTRIYLPEHEPTRLTAALCSVVSLIFGWWGFPWGPIYTFQVLGKNADGGLRVTVGERLAGTQPWQDD